MAWPPRQSLGEWAFCKLTLSRHPRIPSQNARATGTDSGELFMSRPNMSQTRTILIAEDNPDDAFLFRTAYTLGALEHNIHFVHDGDQVLKYLQGLPPYTSPKAFPEPDLLVLDLKMPLMDGWEVIKWV